MGVADVSESNITNGERKRSISDLHGVDGTRAIAVGELSADDFAASAKMERPITWRRARDVVDEIEARAGEPQWPLTLGGDDLVTVGAGEIVVLVAAAKRGKTSLAACLLFEHARDRGPAIVASLELRARVIVARTIGTRCEASWRGVLRGEVERDRMLEVLPERLIVIDRDDVTVAAIEQAIDDMRREHPDEPILLAIDYLQLLPSVERDMRSRVDDSMRQIDQVAQGRNVAVIALSQSSRRDSRALSSGERMGADAADTGAESAAIERWASAIIAIGAVGEPGEDGTAVAELSIAAQRYERGDRVVPARYDGRTGRWRLAGDPKPASDVRAERTAERHAKQVGSVAHAIRDLLAGAAQPMSRREIREKLGGKDTLVRAAVTALLQDEGSSVVEVAPRVRGAYKVWARPVAEAAGRVIIETASQRIPAHPSASPEPHGTASRALVERDAVQSMGRSIGMQSLGMQSIPGPDSPPTRNGDDRLEDHRAVEGDPNLGLEKIHEVAVTAPAVPRTDLGNRKRPQPTVARETPGNRPLAAFRLASRWSLWIAPRAYNEARRASLSPRRRVRVPARHAWCVPLLLVGLADVALYSAAPLAVSGHAPGAAFHDERSSLTPTQTETT